MANNWTQGDITMKVLLPFALLGLAVCAQGTVTIARGGVAKVFIVLQEGATAPERLAAEELQKHLQQITGAQFQIRSDVSDADGAIVVGPGPVASRLFPDVDFSSFGGEELIMRTSGKYLLLAGGRPRGTLYAVFRFLQDKLGVRWWTPWATYIPNRRTLTVPELDVRQTPAFESRDPFWYPAFDGMWAIRNGSNSQHARIHHSRNGWQDYLQGLRAHLLSPRTA